MKTLKKILIIVCVIIIAVGMFFLGRQGLNYAEGYTQNMLLETIKDYALYEGISTAIILIYLIIRYSKQGIIKVAVTSALGIAGAMALVLAIMSIAKVPTTRLFFPIMLVNYVSSLLVVSSHFEKNA